MMLKLKNIEICFILWCLSVFSTFITLKIYPIFFLIFILFYFLTAISHRKLSDEIVKYFISIILFIVLYAISSLLTGFMSPIDLVKLTINYMFFLCSLGLFILNRDHEAFDRSRLIFRTFSIILIFTSVQLCYIIFKLGFWAVPFNGSVQNSTISYMLQTIPIYFGDVNKNIWATKIAFIIIILFSLIILRRVKVSRISLISLLAASFFVMIYTLSRTGQVVLFLFFSLAFFRNIWVDRSVLVKITFSIITIFLLSFIIQKALGSFFHIDLNSKNDGLVSRFFLWKSFYDNISWNHLLIGEGIKSAGLLISSETSQSVDNLHNVFMNITWEAGWISLLIFIFLVMSVFFYRVRGEVRIGVWYKMALFMPFLACVNSHYLGYDADIIVYLSAVFFLRT